MKNITLGEFGSWRVGGKSNAKCKFSSEQWGRDGLRVAGCELWVASCGLWVVGCGMREEGSNVKCKSINYCIYGFRGGCESAG